MKPEALDETDTLSLDPENPFESLLLGTNFQMHDCDAPSVESRECCGSSV